MIDAYVTNIYAVSAIFTVFFILLKRVAYISYIEDAKGFAFAQTWYYWAELMYVLIWANLTPVHTYNEAIGTITLCIIIKAIAGQFTFIDRFLERWFRSR